MRESSKRSETTLPTLTRPMVPSSSPSIASVLLAIPGGGTCARQRACWTALGGDFAEHGYRWDVEYLPDPSTKNRVDQFSDDDEYSPNLSI